MDIVVHSNPCLTDSLPVVEFNMSVEVAGDSSGELALITWKSVRTLLPVLAFHVGSHSLYTKKIVDLFSIAPS